MLISMRCQYQRCGRPWVRTPDADRACPFCGSPNVRETRRGLPDGEGTPFDLLMAQRAAERARRAA